MVKLISKGFDQILNLENIQIYFHHLNTYMCIYARVCVTCMRVYVRSYQLSFVRYDANKVKNF